MIIRKNIIRLGKKKCSYKNDQMRKTLSLLAWNTKLLATIGEIIKTFPEVKPILILEKKFSFPELGKRRCSHTVRITYYRKCDKWNYLFKFLRLKNVLSGNRKEHLL